MLVAPGQKVRYNRWRAYTQALSHRPSQTRYIREGSVVGGFPDLRQLPSEIIFGKARSIRYKVQTHNTQTTSTSTCAMPFKEHKRWETGVSWKSALNNLRLLIQPFIFWCLLEQWLHVFPIFGVKRGFFKLMAYMNDFRISPTTYTQPLSA